MMFGGMVHNKKEEEGDLSQYLVRLSRLMSQPPKKVPPPPPGTAIRPTTEEENLFPFQKLFWHCFQYLKKIG
jgi:hypothetical protein